MQDSPLSRFVALRPLLRLLGVQFMVLTLALFVAEEFGQHIWIPIAAFLLVSVWMGYRVFRPLGRLIRKATRPDRPVPAEPSEEDARDSGGEWEDLESALDRIQSDLREKNRALLEERGELDVLMSSISDAILAIDGSGRIMFFNSRFALLFGAADLVQRKTTLREVFRAPEAIEAFFGALREGETREASLQLHPRADSQVRFFALSVTPLRRPSGEIYGAVGVFHDVSELKQAERMRIDFVANVSHELRTPLTAIKGYIDTMKADAAVKRYEDFPEFVGIISRNADRLLALIEDLLDLSSLEGGAGIERQLLSTREITQRVLGQLEPKRAVKGIEIHTRFEASHVQADGRRLEQVLVNLIDNALKYIPPGGQIRIAWIEGAEGHVVLSVGDNGPGIPEESQARLFERFYRIDKARSREVGGTGLGLAIVKHILQAHGGSVRVQSRPGEGAEFICEFPSA